MMVQAQYQPYKYTARLIDDRRVVETRIYRDAPFPTVLTDLYATLLRNQDAWYTIPNLKELP